MIKKGAIWLICAGLILAQTALASEITPQKVVEHTRKAARLIEKMGEAAFPLLSDPDGEYVDGDLYVFTYNMDGTIVQHLRPALVGKNMLNIKDKAGKCLACDFVRIAKEEGEGWSQYWWPKPSTGELAVKVSYIVKVQGRDYFAGVGVYDMTKAEAEAAMEQ